MTAFPLARLRASVVVLGLTLAGSASAQQPNPLPVAPPNAVVPAPMPGDDAISRLTAPANPCPCPPAEAPPAPPPNPFAGPVMERQKLFGDWLGARSALAAKGINWDIYSTNFYSGVTRGGAEQTFRYRGRADYLLNVDGEKLGLWKGLFVDLHGETIFGDSINRSVGSLLPASIAQGLPAGPNSLTALTGVKFTQFLSEKFLVYGGKINLLDGFNQPFTGGGRGVNGFWNTGMLFNPVLAGTAPYSAFGAGFAVLRNLEPVFAFGVYDTNNTPTVSGFDTFFNNGVDIIAQLNLPTKFFGKPGHQGLFGAWNTGKSTNLAQVAYIDPITGLTPGPKIGGAWSVGYMFDQALFVSPDDPKRSWGMFGNLGMADNNPSPVRWFMNIGVGGSSPFRARKLDSFGVGFYYVGPGSGLRNLAPRLLPLNDEQGVEAFYNIGVTPWCHITPDIQVIVPTRERLDTALFVGLRAKIDFRYEAGGTLMTTNVTSSSDLASPRNAASRSRSALEMSSADPPAAARITSRNRSFPNCSPFTSCISHTPSVPTTITCPGRSGPWTCSG